MNAKDFATEAGVDMLVISLFALFFGLVTAAIALALTVGKFPTGQFPSIFGTDNYDPATRKGRAASQKGLSDSVKATLFGFWILCTFAAYNHMVFGARMPDHGFSFGSAVEAAAVAVLPPLISISIIWGIYMLVRWRLAKTRKDANVERGEANGDAAVFTDVPNTERSSVQAESTQG